MKFSTWRHCRRYLVILLFLIILFTVSIHFKLYAHIYNIYDDDTQQPVQCNQDIIRKHFMDDKTPQQLFEQPPVRTGFTFEIANENFCSTVKPHAIIFVISKSSNYHSRNAIRRTWGNLAPIKSLSQLSYLEIKVLFLIDIDETRLLTISLEQTLFNDIVQVRLPQYYSLSTYRDMAMLYWTDQYCPETIMTVKTDDDIFINIYLLANLIDSIIKNTTINQSKLTCNYSDSSAIMYGFKIRLARVVRHSNDPFLEGTRYIVADEEYPCLNYPHYLSGFSYIVNRNARTKLLCTFLRDKKPFHLSDVYVTGIIPEYVGIVRKHFGLFINYRSDDDCEKFFKTHDLNSYACASSMHYNNKHIDVFERFNTYLKIVYEKRRAYIERKFYLVFREPNI